MKSYISLIVFTIIGVASNAQQLEVTTDLVSQNIWRGAYIADASIQPSITISEGNFELTVWSSAALRDKNYEMDVILSYSLGNFSIGLTDYWSDTVGAKYGKGHLLEFNYEYNFKRIPLIFSWNMALDSWCSSYAEISYHKHISEFEVEFDAGLTPWRNQMLDTKSFAFTKISVGVSKEFQTKNISIKPSCSLIYNPYTDQMFLMAGIGFSF